MATGFPARVALLAICAMAGHAHAERRQVAVISLSAEPEASQLANELYNALVDHPDLQPLRTAVFVTALQGPFEDEDADNLRRARQARADADTALGLAQPDYRGAGVAAKRGLDALAMVTPSGDMLQIYGDLMFDLGQAQLGQGKAIDASRSFMLARRLDPGRIVDRGKYLPEIADAYDATANKPGATSQLVIKGDGTAWIDGKSVGDAPHEEPIADGLHLVQLTGPDREPRGDQVLVPAIPEVNIAPAPATDELKVKRARLELAHAKDAMTRASAVKRLAHLLGVGDAVIIAKAPTGTSLQVQTWQDRDPGFSAIREHHEEKPIELLTPLAPPRKPEPPKVVILPTPPPVVIETPWYRKRWVQASAATGILAVIVTAVAIVRSDRMTTLDTDIKPYEPGK